MKRRVCYIFCLILTILLVSGCESGSVRKGELKRIDVEVFETKEIHVFENNALVKVEQLLNEASWDNRAIKSIQGDARMVLFYEEGKNMPERLHEYEIYFHETNGTAILAGKEEPELYTELNQSKTSALKKALPFPLH